MIDRSKASGQRDASDRAVPGAIARLVRERTRTPTDDLSTENEFDIAPFTARPDSDWEQDAPAVLGGEPDDSQVELPAFTSATDPSDEIDSSPAFETESPEGPLAVPWYYKYIESWGRLHFYVMLGFAASSLAVLGCLLVSALVAGNSLSSSVTALIIGCVGTIAFLLLSLSATVLIILVVDLERSVRTLIQQSERNPAQPGDNKNQTRRGLSHPVG